MFQDALSEVDGPWRGEADGAKVDDIELDSSELFAEAESFCPHCGEPVVLAVDVGGGPVQKYVEDCEVCCRPWAVTVRFAPDGFPTVELDVTE